MFQRVLLALFDQSKNLNEEYVLDRIDKFVRRQTQKIGILKGAQRIQ
jgi:hypothetical protein